MSLEKYKVYYTKGENVFSYYDIDGVLIPANTILYTEKDVRADGKYTDRNDARYVTFLRKVKSGKKVINFKSSPYYKYYIERAKKDNPEILI